MAKRYRAELLQDEIAALCRRVGGIERAVVVSLDGFVVASYPPAADDEYESPLHSLQVAATAAGAISLGETALERLAHGDFERLIIDGKSGAMIVYPIGATDAALVAITNKSAKTGLASFAMRQSVSKLGDILSGDVDT
jgi:predicted regulator of Ras-like GTPase activity (Roadblock/LC7/MglB family)